MPDVKTRHDPEKQVRGIVAHDLDHVFDGRRGALHRAHACVWVYTPSMVLPAACASLGTGDVSRPVENSSGSPRIVLDPHATLRATSATAPDPNTHPIVK